VPNPDWSPKADGEFVARSRPGLESTDFRNLAIGSMCMASLRYGDGEHARLAPLIDDRTEPAAVLVIGRAIFFGQSSSARSTNVRACGPAHPSWGGAFARRDSIQCSEERNRSGMGDVSLNTMVSKRCPTADELPCRSATSSESSSIATFMPRPESAWPHNSTVVRDGSFRAGARRWRDWLLSASIWAAELIACLDKAVPQPI
jgi:hypothetical protein